MNEPRDSGLDTVHSVQFDIQVVNSPRGELCSPPARLRRLLSLQRGPSVSVPAVSRLAVSLLMESRASAATPSSLRQWISSRLLLHQLKALIFTKHFYPIHAEFNKRRPPLVAALE